MMGRVKELLMEGEDLFYASLDEGMTNDQALDQVASVFGTMVRDGVEAQHELECSIGYMEREDG
tara:strand:+ start:1507 stop:1698 length:192 start_codon:yes stop_codon:yes gene_type:complete